MQPIADPILFMQNITGFMVGTRYEQGGIIKDGAKLINAVSNSTVPHLTLMMGASYGAGNYRMSGRAYDPRFIFTWPNHRIAVAGPKQLAGVMTIVARSKIEGAGGEWNDETEAMIAPMRDALEQQVEAESTALFATGRVWDDGIIDPRDTRTALSLRCRRATARPSTVSARATPMRWRLACASRLAVTSEPGGCDGMADDMTPPEGRDGGRE